MNCPNCSSEAHGNFCSICGQALDRSRITWGYFFEEVQHRVFGFDNKFVRTVVDLTIRPEKVILTVIDGIKMRYFGPLGYYFLLVTIYVLLISILDIDMAKLSESMFTVAENTTREQASAQAKINKAIFEYFRLFSLIMLPFFILGNFLIFKNKKYNYLENGVVVLYAMGHPMLLSIFFLITYKLSEFTLSLMAIMLISFIYYCWVCARFYKGNKLWNFIKGIFAQITSYIILFLFTMIVFLIYFLLFPEAAEQFAP